MMISSPRAPKTCLHVIYNDMALRTLEVHSDTRGHERPHCCGMTGLKTTMYVAEPPSLRLETSPWSLPASWRNQFS